MKFRSLLFPFACFASAALASADTFVMKDGTKFEGSILKETDTHYELEVRIGKSIRDEKTVAKSDVAEIIAEKKDEKAFEALKGLVPAPDLSTPDEYARRMGALSKFIADYPKSPKAAEAQSMVDILKAEAEAVAAGGIKVDGKVLNADEYRADMYDIDAKILEKRIRKIAASGDIFGALRGLDRMDLDFRLTSSRKALGPLKKQLVQLYKEQISEQLSSYEKRAAERETNLSRMNGERRTATERAINEELDRARARYKADKEARLVWVFTDPYLPDSLKDTMEAIEDVESGELDEAIDESKDSGRIYRNILKFIGTSTDPHAIEDAIAQGYDARIPDRYLENLKALAVAKGIQF